MGKTIVIVGHFGNQGTAYGGQISKTRNYTAELRLAFPDNRIYEADTMFQSFFDKLIKLARMVYLCLKSDVVIILPGQNGIKKILPITVALKSIRGFLLLYPVVGGWLSDFTEHNKTVARDLKKVDRIYVETKSLLRSLNDRGYDNVEWAPVFSRRQIPENLPWRGVKEPTFCVFSRITPEKGIGLAIQAVNHLNTREKRAKYKLDFYGAIAPEYENEFKSLIENSPYDAIRYNGKMKDEDVIRTLADHSAMLFPTSYSGEGFPATVLEGMMAGLPVIASDWRYNNEIIIPGFNGYLFDLKDDYIGLANAIELFSDNEEKAGEMHENSKKRALDYTPRKVLSPMCQLIETRFKRKTA